MFQRASSFCVFSTFLCLLSIVSEIYGGSPCPPRRSIYPCMCTEIPKARKSIYTVVTCSHVPSTSELSNAFHTFKEMHVDRMIIVDSFSEAHSYGKEADDHRELPQNWFSHLRINEMEIIDSYLSPCFACNFSEMCRNTLTTRLSVVNSSQSDKLCTVCQVGNRQRFSWIACLSHLKYFDFRQNNLESVRHDFFPITMKDVLEVNMSSNRISTLGRDAFRNFPKLVKLDLSHNNIRDVLEDIFGIAKMNLKFLDLSWNQIISVSSDILKLTPSLRFLHLQNNLIEKVDENTWKHMSPRVLTFNLSDNRINCDCCLSWLNSTLNTWTVVHGLCATPSKYNATPLRRASRLLTRQCANITDSVERC